ncbi:hypothetical protein ACFW5I_19005 [Streptomyces sp. NPDC058818]|uniref:hypothetical protein n=1 Tax=Streptomyces sp. NPDC058818 TaxID=3346640 RepID=UPI0036B5908C
MRTFAEVAVGFPVFHFTVALLVVTAFWLLVAVGAVGSRCFDKDVDAAAWRLGEVPVAVSFSLMTVFAWSGALAAGLLLEPVVSGGVVRALTGFAVVVTAPVAASLLTRLLARLWRRHVPDERGPSRTATS